MKLCYLLHKGRGIVESISDTVGDSLTISVSPCCDGYIMIKDTPYRVKNGEVTLPLRALCDGRHSLRLECEGHGYILEPFTKEGAHIAPSYNGEEAVRDLLLSYAHLEALSDAIEKRVAQLERLCEGHHIFN